MPKRSPIGQHIVSRVDRALRLDRNLTVKKATKELGISESSYYKMRAGTRTGQGSIKTRVIDRPRRGDGRPQSVSNEFNIVFTSRDGTRKASRNIRVEGAYSGADALVLAHDPRIKRAVQKQLEAEERAGMRKDTGSPVWKRRDRQSLDVQEVSRVVYASKPGFLVKAKR